MVEEGNVSREPWMAYALLGEQPALYDPVNTPDEWELDFTDWRTDDNCSGRIVVVRGDRRPAIWLEDLVTGPGDIEACTQLGSVYHSGTQAFETDDMDGVGWDDEDEIQTTWNRAKLFADALNAAESA